MEENRAPDLLSKTTSDKKEDVRVFEDVLEEILHLLEFNIDNNIFRLH